MTTRRLPPGPTPPGVRSPVRESRVGRTRSPEALTPSTGGASEVADGAADALLSIGAMVSS